MSSIRAGRQTSRQRLLDCAICFFRAKGYSATGIDEIVKACGITKGSLYYHFESKESLAFAAIDQIHDYFRTHIFSLITDVEHPGTKEFGAFNKAIEEFFLSHPDGCLIANLCLEIGVTNALFAKQIASYFSDWRACYFSVFTSVHAPAVATMLAEDALAIIQGCILMHRINGDLAPLQRQHRTLVDLLSPKIR